MSLYMEAQTCLAPETCSVAASKEQELFAQWGFSPAEIASLLWLRRSYKFDEGDHAATVRSLEFLRLLVSSGELEL